MLFSRAVNYYRPNLEEDADNFWTEMECSINGNYSRTYSLSNAALVKPTNNHF
jgi:hypothetical protein